MKKQHKIIVLALASMMALFVFIGCSNAPATSEGTADASGQTDSSQPLTIAELEPNANILSGLTISRNNIQDAEQEIIDWVQGLES